MTVLCSVCKNPTIAMCAQCRRPVCSSGYGLSGTCGLQHEEVCAAAKECRLGASPKKDREFPPASTFQLQEAESLSGKLVRRFGRLCERIVVVGHVRIRDSVTQTLELVVVPKYEGRVNLVWKELNEICSHGPDAAYTLIDQKERWIVGRVDRQRSILIYFHVATPENLGWVILERTGPEAYVSRFMRRLNQKGYSVVNDEVRRIARISPVPVPSEEDLFRFAGLKFKDPWKRK